MSGEMSGFMLSTCCATLVIEILKSCIQGEVWDGRIYRGNSDLRSTAAKSWLQGDTRPSQGSAALHWTSKPNKFSGTMHIKFKWLSWAL